MTKPPLDLMVEITDANQVRSRWDSNAKFAGDRPQNLSFATKRGEGFAEGSVTLTRRVDRDYVDLHLFDDVALVGADGSVAYEGRVAAMPRSVQAAHSVTVQLAGHMAHARDRPFTEIYVDRDLGAWQPPSRTRQTALMASDWGVRPFEATRDTTSAPALAMRIEGSWTSPYKPLIEAVYDAGSECTVEYVYVWLRGSSIVDATFEFYVHGGSTDASIDVSSSDLWAGVDNAAYRALSSPRRFVTLQYLYNTTPAGANGATFSLFASDVAVYGSHGLSVWGTNPGGVLASDVIRDIAARFCPKLKTTGVQDTAWPVPHLAFKEPTDPYDAFLALNAFHLWELGVWEDKTLHFAPADRTDYDWEARLSDFGTVVDLQGDSSEDLVNGVFVNFTNVQTGMKETLSPAIYSDLVDTDPNNPATLHGLSRWTLKIDLSAPTTVDAALQIGRAALVEYNAPKAPGTITITGHLKDRAGHWQQGWKVRAGDTISITDHPNDAPRLITETQWDHDQKELRITVDGTAKRLDAVLDRLGTALSAAGLS